VFTARYGLIPFIKQRLSLFIGLMDIGLPSLGKSGQSVNLNAHLDLAPNLEMSGNTHIHLCARGVHRDNFLFLNFFIPKYSIHEICYTT
jgi:hypothetical protein